MSVARYCAYKDSGVDWLGSIPEHWEVVRNKNLFAEIDIRNEKDDEELLTVSHLTGVTKRSEKNVNMFLAETLRGYKCCRNGDLVINTMWAWMGALGITLIDGVVSPSYNVYRPRNITRLSPRYYDYLFRIPDHIRVVKANSTGVWESRLRLYPNTFLSMKTCFPPYNEQVTIVDFLDRETAKIDALVEEQEKLIALLKEKRQAVISHTVTKGINPSVSMKDSGVEWLGEVPEHWNIAPIKAIATCNDDVLQDSTPSDYEIEYVEISSVDAVRGVVETTVVPFGDAPSRARRRVQDGDVIVSTVRTYLRAITPLNNPAENMIVSTGFAVIRPRKVDTHFLGYLFRAEFLIAEIISRSVGISYPAINAHDLMCLKIPIPPSHEQFAISGFLKQKTREYDTLVTEAKRSIELLKERRSVLISAAVTGQIDVRRLVAEEVTL